MKKKHKKISWRRKEKAGKKNIFLKILGGIFLGLIILISLPFFRVWNGPFGDFVPHATKFWNADVLVLLQNEAEIRPTGGFLSAIALVEIRSGKPNIQIIDTYSITEPKRQQKAPDAIHTIFSKDKKYRGWVFRDTNYNPDFQDSIIDIQRFLKYDKRFTERKFDAIISVNFSVLERLFSVLGPIDGVSKNDLFRLLQRETKNIDLHSKKELDTRKSGLGDLAQKLISQISPGNIFEIIEEINEACQKKEIQMYFSDQDLQKIVTEKNWGGAQPKENFYSVIVSNLGAKKSDRFIHRTITSEFTVDAHGKTTEKLSLRFHHAGTQNLLSDPGNYDIRVFRPGGTKQSGGNKKWNQITEENAEVFSHMMFLRPGEIREIIVEFQLPEIWQNGKRDFTFVQQSGTEAYLNVIFRSIGDRSFSATGCDTSHFRENVFFCENKLNSDKNITGEIHPDVLPPFLENAFYENEKELFLRFNEPISLLEKNEFSVTCKNKTYMAEKKLMRNKKEGRDWDARDARIVLKDSPGFTKEFCQLKWTGVADVFGNTTEVKMTLPSRLEY